MRVAVVLVFLASAAAAGEVAFVDVNVVPMDSKRVLERQTVLVRDGRIVAVGAVAVPAGAQRIDGCGRYLMPGLADMHVHNWYAEEHVLFLASGVTSVRNLWGTRQHLRWRDEIERGERLGPTLYTTGPILDGAKPIWEKSVPVPDVAAARRVVAEQHARGYRSIKVYAGLTPAVYTALVAAAREKGMRVTGHVPAQVGIWGVLEAKQDCIEHLDGYGAWQTKFRETWMAEAARRTARAGTWNCATLVVYRKFVPLSEANKLRARPEMRYVPPRLRATWDPTRDFRLKDLSAGQFRRIELGNRNRLRITKVLHDVTGRVLLGTDCGNPFVVAGWSVHEELGHLVEAGLSPYEALACATRKAAQYLGEPFGTIEAGKRADLVLVEGNPLEDVASAARIAGVMVRGRWLPADELKRRLEEVAASYGKPKRRFEELGELPRGEVFRYEITWNGMVVGEERFVIDDRGSIHAQRVNDPPWQTTETLVLHRDGTGSIRYADPVSEFEAEVSAPEGGKVVRGYPSFAGWMVVRRSFSGVGVGEEAVLDYRELNYDSGEPEERKIPLRVRREKGEGTYTIWMTRKDATYKSRLVFDEAGRPLELVTVLQQGTIRIARAK